MHAPGDANLRIEITRTRPAAGAGTPGRRALARGRAGRYTITTGPASSYTPPELDKPRGGRGRYSRTNRTATHRPPDWRLLRAGCARGARGVAAGRAPAARRREAHRTHPEREATPNSNHSELRMGAHVSRRGFCEENVPSQWRLVYRLFTGVLPVGTSRLRQRSPSTDTSLFTQAVKHRHFTSTAIETHMPCAAPGHHRGAHVVGRVSVAVRPESIAHTYPPTPKQETVHTTRICLSALGRS